MLQDKTLTVTEINSISKELLESTFSNVSIEGEISNLKQHSSKHWYFDLKDEQSQISCVMFAGNNNTVTFKPKDGDLVQLKARVSLYTVTGRYQLIVSKMSQAGEGILRRKYEELVKKLTLAGLFDPSLKKHLPKIPKKIGIITSSTGAAIKDILSVLKRRFTMLPIIIYPTQVQGNKAAQEIINALSLAIAHNQCDVLIIARGGGSLEDLWAFNNEELAKAIFNCHIPIISGVGHETDVTITDFVADVRAPTPSAAAEIASPNQQDILESLKIAEQKMTLAVTKQINHLQQKLTALNKYLRDPKYRIKEQKILLNNLVNNIDLKIKRNLIKARNNFNNLMQKLNIVSPLATLNRGYSIVSTVNTASTNKNHQIITDTKKLKINDKIDIQFNSGRAICNVEQITV